MDVQMPHFKEEVLYHETIDATNSNLLNSMPPIQSLSFAFSPHVAPHPGTH
jgi:hypothetical protein